MRRISYVVSLAVAALIASACTSESTIPTSPAAPAFTGGGMVGSGNGVSDPDAGTTSVQTDTTGRGGGLVGSGN